MALILCHSANFGQTFNKSFVIIIIEVQAAIRATYVGGSNSEIHEIMTFYGKGGIPGVTYGSVSAMHLEHTQPFCTQARPVLLSLVGTVRGPVRGRTTLQGV